MATFATSDQLLVVIDPVARRTDGESVRIAKDVLSAGATTKVCLPEGPEEFARALARRGSRRPVVVGDDRALVRAVSLLHRQRELAGCVLSVVPVGGALALAETLGVPTGAVAAARAVLDGVERRMDLLVDDSDGVVLGALRIPPVQVRQAAPLEPVPAAPGRPWLRTTYRSLVRTLGARPSRLATSVPGPGPARLRVEVDGVTLVDLDQPVEGVSVTTGSAGLAGLAEVEVRPASVGAEASPLRASGRTVTVAGPDFRYRADAEVAGPVRRRTWQVVEGAWGLTVPQRAGA
ncbi:MULTISPECIES: diacylglycerol kinase family protein [Streptomyces]|uniref:diacylglycerol kinase family protein n=1 Tax=Streptomyces TaxID=1883 RepID=UPI0029313F97|nr:diacylglycerol kinase family protein [Streptomyces sp. NEAU-HV9]